MARRSPPVVNQTCETGCTWRMFGLFNFGEGHSNRRLVSNGRHLNTHTTAAGNGSSRRSSDVLNKVDEKYPHTAASSRRRRDYGCKSISCVENDQVADQGNKVTKMTIDQKLVNTNYIGKEGAGCQPEQLLDALQILYSNKELFLKLLQDPNSLLVKQIHDLQSSQAKEPYEAMEKRTTRLNKYQNSNARQCGKLFESSERYDSNSSSESQFSNKIVVLKPSTNNAENFADTQLGSPGPNSASSFNYNAQNIKPSHFPLGRIKRKLRYALRVRRKEQQWIKTDEVPGKYPCGCQGLEDDKKVKELERIEEMLNSSLDLKKRDRITKMKDSELRMGKEITPFGESCSRITYNASVSPSEQSTMNTHVEDRISQSDMIKCGIEEFKECTNSPRRMEPFPDFESFPSLQRYPCKHGSADEGMRYYYNYQMDHRTKLGLQKEGGNDPYSSFQDSHPEIQIVPFSPEVASTSPSSCERIEDTINMSKRAENPSYESVFDHFTEKNMINPPVTTFQPDESIVQVEHEKSEENHFADLIRSSLDDATINLAFSKDTLDCLREILQAFSLNWDVLVAKYESSGCLHDPSHTFNELKGSIGRLPCDTAILDCAIETFMEVYQNYYGFPVLIATRNPNVQAYVAKKVLVKEISELMNSHFLPHPTQITLEQLVGKDLARSGSWLNIQVDTEDIVMEVEEDVLEDLVLEIVSEMDIRRMMH